MESWTIGMYNKIGESNAIEISDVRVYSLCHAGTTAVGIISLITSLQTQFTYRFLMESLPYAEAVTCISCCHTISSPIKPTIPVQEHA